MTDEVTNTAPGGADTQQGSLLGSGPPAGSPPSTNGNASTISPGKSARFGFEVNTSGSVLGSYALSYGTSTPQFGQARTPAASSLAVSGPCK